MRVVNIQWFDAAGEVICTANVTSEAQFEMVMDEYYRCPEAVSHKVTYPA